MENPVKLCVNVEPTACHPESPLKACGDKLSAKDLHVKHDILRLFLFAITIICVLSLSGCASSPVAREAAANVDIGVQNAKNLADNATSGNIADSYQNSTQMTKGVLIGGAAGAVAGSMTSGVGVLHGAAIGAIIGGAYGSYIDSLTTRADRLDNRGANIIVLGDQILIVIPSARLFEPMTATLKPQAYSTLHLVAQYINQYVKMLVKVAAYTDDSGSSAVDIALSQQQAQRVAKALMMGGINARVLYSEGYGASRLVTRNTNEWDTDNYRIEISLEKLYV